MFEGVDTKRIQFFSDKRTDSLDDLKIVFLIQSRYTKRCEIDGFCFLRNALKFFGLLQSLFIKFHVLAEQNLGLICPLVPLYTAWEELDGFVHLCLKFSIHVGDLAIGSNAESVQLLFNKWPNALDDLEIVLDRNYGRCTKDASYTFDTGESVTVLAGP